MINHKLADQKWNELQQYIFNGLDQPASIIGQFFDDYPEGVKIVNASTKIIYYNKAQGRLDGLEPATVIGRTVLETYYMENSDTFPSSQCCFERRAIIDHTCYYRTCKGREVNSTYSIFPIFSCDNILGCICFSSGYNVASKKLNLEKLGSIEDSSQVSTSAVLVAKNFCFDDVITQNVKFEVCLDKARSASLTPSSVMIYGETGTGKEMIAQAMHNYSPRHHKPFMAINCAAIPEASLEGVLFGTTKGAFVGAEDKPGMLELANGGTLFLDEISFMPLGMQSKILRSIQEKTVRRVGASREVAVDFKIISATNINPRVAVKNGDLRSDLFYRLAVVMLAIPPLRERRRDIELLCAYFIKKLNLKLNRNVESIAPEVIRAFNSHHWSGNVRELEHVVEGAMNSVLEATILNHTHFSDFYAGLAFDDEFGHISGLETEFRFPPNEADGCREDGESRFDLSLASAPNMERNGIIIALEESSGNASQAARSLGISPQLMRYKMKKYNLKKGCVVT